MRKKNRRIFDAVRCRYSKEKCEVQNLRGANEKVVL
jgi:hypothetical protein